MRTPVWRKRDYHKAWEQDTDDGTAEVLVLRQVRVGHWLGLGSGPDAGLVPPPAPG